MQLGFLSRLKNSPLNPSMGCITLFSIHPLFIRTITSYGEKYLSHLENTYRNENCLDPPWPQSLISKFTYDSFWIIRENTRTFLVISGRSSLFSKISKLMGYSLIIILPKHWKDMKENEVNAEERKLRD